MPAGACPERSRRAGMTEQEAYRLSFPRQHSHTRKRKPRSDQRVFLDAFYTRQNPDIGATGACASHLLLERRREEQATYGRQSVFPAWQSRKVALVDFLIVSHAGDDLKRPVVAQTQLPSQILCITKQPPSLRLGRNHADVAAINAQLF